MKCRHGVVPARVVGLVLFVVVLVPARAAPAQTVTPMVVAGNTAGNGVTLSGFEGSSAASQNAAVFQGRTSALMLASGGTLATVLTSGAVAPAPVIGFFNEFRNAAINNNGDIVFWATLGNVNPETSGLFVRSNTGNLTTVALNPPFNAREPADINFSGNVVWTDRQRTLFVFDLASGANTQLATINTAAPGGGNWRRFGEVPVISDTGSVAFVADLNAGGQDGVFLFDNATGAFTAIAQTGGTNPVLPAGVTWGNFALDDAVSINNLDQVAFTARLSGGASTAGVFVFNPANGTITSVIQTGNTPVGAPGPIVDIDPEYVGIEDLGLVMYEAVFAPNDQRLFLDFQGQQGPVTPNIGSAARWFSPRVVSFGLTSWFRGQAIEIPNNSATVTTIVGPTTVTPIGQDVSVNRSSVNDLAEVVFTATHRQLYEYTGVPSTATQRAQAGGPSPRGGGSTITTLDQQIMRGPRIAFSVFDTGPGGGSSGYAIGYRDNTFPGFGTLNAVASGDPVPATAGGGTLTLNGSAFDVANKQVYFISAVTGGALAKGIFRVKPTRPARLMLGTGAAAPGGSSFVDFDETRPLLQRGGAILFTADLANGQRGLYLMKTAGPPVVKIAELGDPVPGTGSTIAQLGSVDLGPLGEVLYTVNLANGANAIVFDRGGGAQLVAQDGQTAPGTGGGTFAIGGLAFGTDVPLGLGSGLQAVFTSQVQAGTVTEGMFKYDPTTGVVSSVIVAGAASPVGGTFSSFDDTQDFLSVGSVDAVGQFFVNGAGSANGLFGVQY